MKEQEIAIALSKKYPSPQYAFLTHVRNQTGWGNSGTVRTADALALGLWKSRGYNLEGFEIKDSRADWLNEWKNPAKADSLAKYCDYWWLVVSDSKIVSDDELPKNWGLKTIVKGHIVTIKEARRNMMVEPMSRDFLCGFMRKMDENLSEIYTPTIEVEKIVKERVASQLSSAVENANYRVRDYDRLIENIRKFEEASGLKLMEELAWTWSRPEKIGEAVRFVMDGKHSQILPELIRQRDTIQRILNATDDEIKKITNISNTK